MMSYLVLASVVAIFLLYLLKKQSRRTCSWPRDTVIVHDIGRGPYAPSLSPFPLKLQTYLRMANIKHMVDHTSGFSTKGKTPWISYNDMHVADSQFCIEFCNAKFQVDLNKHLSDQDKAVARALQKLTEENLYWTMCAVTFGDDLTSLESLLPYNAIQRFITARLLRFFIWRQMRGHGIGRHTRQEILRIGRQDLQALSYFLGDNAYMLGAQPCEVDCAVFGMLAQILHHMPTAPHARWITDDFSNLSRYCERMKSEYWPDWDQLINCHDTKQSNNNSDN